ncbi:surface carbohydrate biosynthesis protein [Pseudodesulfovibrio senegalensis]|uniref:surface carbohydrate biosynthesis protein n=1 Tax=Pseudodesulfovibrio senegalensis TaxID=1721087 RepID=UPI0013760F35|nr:surface carbohydrate biosynthesis protein [Pseudodesulfovibrio senegalensis]
MIRFGKKRPWLYLPAEIKVREFEAKVLIASMAASRGFNVVFGDVAPVLKVARNGPPGVFMFKDCSYPMMETFRELHELGHRVCVHDEEGLVVFNDEIFLNFRVDNRSAQYVDLFFAWGKEQEKILLKKIEPERVARTGHPRFDILRRDLRGIFDEDVRDIQERYGRFILINSNLGAWNHQDGPEGYIRICKEQEALDNPEDVDFYVRYQNHVKGLWDRYVPLVRRLAEDFPQHSIVVRPHPVEDVGTWERLMANEPRVFVDDDGTVAKWIYAADVVVHTNCTTAIESIAMETPVFSYLPSYDPEFDCDLPNDFSKVCRTDDELSAALSCCVGGEGFASFGEQRVLLKQYVSAIEGDFSASRIVDQLERIALPSEKMRVSLRHTLLPKLRLEFDRMLGKSKSTQKWPHTSLIEVQELVSRYCHFLVSLKNIKIAHLGRNLFSFFSINK